MSIMELIALFVIMATLSMIPSASVALVVTRSATLGIANGVAVAAGIVFGDLVFILLVVLGLSVVAEALGGLFIFIKYMGGAYLLWLGFSLLMARNKATVPASKSSGRAGVIASFLAGLLLTLGDVKAVFFYVSLFPAFLDLSALNGADLIMIILLTIVAVGGAKVFYALSARKMVLMSRALKMENAAQKTAGGFMVGAGCYLIVKA